MRLGNITGKLFAVALIGGACFVASLFILGLINERQGRFDEAKQEIANSWSKRQTLVGPMLIVRNSDADVYVLPAVLHYETMLVPEVRTRGIFRSVVYGSLIKVSGEFLAEDIRQATTGRRDAVLSVVITDTRGIEKQVELIWNDSKYAFEPGPGVTFPEPQLQNASGLHAFVPVNPTPDTSSKQRVPFYFEIELKGSEGVLIAPLGKETVFDISSSWPTPKFVGAFLPSQRSITSSGFTSEWRISSFGRPYPQVWQQGSVDLTQLLDSSAGVELHEQVDAYDLVSRSITYAILFIVITFAAFFLFDVLTKARVHPIQYLLIGSGLSLFYLLLLSLSEHISFFLAYIVATGMIAVLISAYSAFVLSSVRRALPIFALLFLLYGYLYFVLQLEDYALLFGALLLFVFLAVIMFATRHVDWFTLDKPKDEMSA